MALKTNQPIRWKERIGIMAIGHTFKNIEESIFDYVIYPAIIALLGTVVGGIVMTIASATECYLFLRLYDWSKKDWFGFELLKRVRDGEEKNSRVGSFFQRVTRKGNWLAFLILSCSTDPFMTTVYMRKGAESYNGLSSRDWRIFWTSVVVGNLWWTVIVSFAVAGVRLILSWLGLN